LYFASTCTTSPDFTARCTLPDVFTTPIATKARQIPTATPRVFLSMIKLLRPSVTSARSPKSPLSRFGRRVGYARELLRRPPFFTSLRPDAVLVRVVRRTPLRTKVMELANSHANRCVGPAPRTHDADAEPVQVLLAHLSCGPLPRAILQWSGLGSTSLPPTQ